MVPERESAKELYMLVVPLNFSCNKGYKINEEGRSLLLLSKSWCSLVKGFDTNQYELLFPASFNSSYGFYLQ